MLVQDAEIPDAVIERLTRMIAAGDRTEAALEFEATKLLLIEGITDPQRLLPGRLVAHLRETVH